MCFSSVAGGSTATLSSTTKRLGSQVQSLIQGNEVRISSFCVMVSCVGNGLTTDPPSSKEYNQMTIKTQHLMFSKQCCWRFMSSGMLDHVDCWELSTFWKDVLPSSVGLLDKAYHLKTLNVCLGRLLTLHPHLLSFELVSANHFCWMFFRQILLKRAVLETRTA
jgi:hypothetical protein